MQTIKEVFQSTSLRLQFALIAAIELAMLAAVVWHGPQEFMDLKLLVLMMTAFLIIPISSMALYMEHEERNAKRLAQWVQDDDWKQVKRSERWEWDSSWEMFFCICAMSAIAWAIQVAA